MLLSLINYRGKIQNKIYIGDRINIAYRYRGVFSLVTGYCISRRQKSLGVYEKKKNFYYFSFIAWQSIVLINKMDTFFYNQISWKCKYRLN